MPSVQTENTSLTILSGAELFPSAPTSGPDVALWTPVTVAAVAGGSVPAIAAVGSRIYVKPNTATGYDNASAAKGTRSAKFVVGGSAVDSDANHGSTANCILFQVKAPEGLEAPLNAKLPTVNAQISAEADATVTEITAIDAMGPLVANVLDVDDSTGLITICVTLKTIRPVKGLVEVSVDFGYSASN